MPQKMEFPLASSEAVENALGERIEAIRLGRNITQSRLADEAGVSRSTITRLTQRGKGISLDSFIRILKALQLDGNLETLLPDPGLSPLAELEKERRPSRQRARTRTRRQAGQQSWLWQDDGDTS